jgi:membrane-bound lytic murein transglycosylase B
MRNSTLVLVAAALAALLAGCTPAPAVRPEDAPVAPADAAAPVLDTTLSYANYTEHPLYPAFRDRMVAQGFSAGELDALFSKVNRDQRVLDAITRPAEAKPWHLYRPIFVTRERIDGGVAFWDQHAATLQRAASEFGVDPEMIVAIIGVETRYGAIMGKFPVISTLATLSFDFPPRARFFTSELEQFLVLSKEQGWDPMVPVGSYAGAMGAGQFISSSHRRYAVDYSGDGRIQLSTDMVDVIGSVANYFRQHGWVRGDIVAAPAALKAGAMEPARTSSIELATAGGLRGAFTFTDGLADDAPALYVALDNADATKSYWVGAKNFWVITRYNRSPLYAMAAHELSQEIIRARLNRATDAAALQQ